MAILAGCAAMSHAPQLLTQPEDWKKMPARTKRHLLIPPDIEQRLTDAAVKDNFDRCHLAIGQLRNTIASWRCDAIIVLGDDQHENFFEDNMPAFAVYIEDQVRVTRKFSFYGENPIDQSVTYPVRKDLAFDLLTKLMATGFDPAWCKKTRYEGGLGHAFGRVLHLVQAEAKTPILPLMVNTYFPPAPSAARCIQLGKSLRTIIESWPDTMRIGVLASGGLTHTRLDEDLDAQIIRALETYDEVYLSSLPADELIEGTSEIRNWIIAAAIAGGPATMVDYIPCYRTPDGAGCGMGFAHWGLNKDR